MRCDLLEYDLPPELIASHPPAARDGARMLVVDRGGGLRDGFVRELAADLEPGALVVMNDTRVISARLLGHKIDTGGRVELLLLRRIDEGGERTSAQGETWEALGRASKGLRPGARIAFGDHLEAHVDARSADARGVTLVTLSSPTGRSILEAIEAVGHVPLPPYVRRPDDATDRDRYQTLFARVPGAVAAPTAGLHFSQALLDRLEARGIARTSVTLHVGLGTFQPVTAADLDDHPMHTERFSVTAATVASIARARERGAPVVAIGTTVVRALESAADPERPGHVRAVDGETRLLIQPGYAFRVVDALLTNFHLPRSTLLALVCAFAGRERVLSAYEHAIAARYRFYSYGDAMLLRRGAEAGR